MAGHRQGSDDVSCMSIAQARPGFFAPFQVRPFRLQFAADLLTCWGMEMEVIVLGWYILVETQSVFLLTLYGALQYGGTLIAPALGVASDRLGHRAVLTVMRTVYATVAVMLMALSATGALHPTYVLFLAGISGLIRASDNGIRSALTAEILPPDRLMGGIGLARITSDSARIAGALAGAAVYAAIGMVAACLMFATFYILGVILTWTVGAPPRHPAPTARPTPFNQMREGVIHVWHTPALMAGMWLAFLVNLTAFPWTLGLLPYVAHNVLNVGQTGLGFMAASFSIGGLTGSLLISLAGRRIPAARLMLVGGFAWHAMLLVFVQTPDLASACAVLILAGIVQSMNMVPLMVMLLRIAGQKFRGRVMGVRMLAIYGLPMGLLIAGALIPHIGYWQTATLYCTTGLLGVLAIAWYWRAALWPRGLPVNTG